MSKVLVALAIQVFALVILAAGVYLLHYMVSPPYPFWALVLAQALLASLLTVMFKLPVWWRWIQFLLPWALFAAFTLELSPWFGLAAFVVLWLLFANAGTERVPLYLTNRTTRQAFKALIQQLQAKQGDDAAEQISFMDLGCGLGGNVVFMAQQPEVNRSQGVETAPLPYLMAKLLTKIKGGEVFAQDLWETPLQEFSLVYAFLSTEPMPRLWEKVQAEMQPGSIFVSNSFAVPGVEPSEVWELSDRRQTRLFIYCL